MIPVAYTSAPIVRLVEAMNIKPMSMVTCLRWQASHGMMQQF